MQGDIGVAKSVDKGATWEQLGIALDEEWHLSYPYVFNYHDQVRMEFFCHILQSSELYESPYKMMLIGTAFNHDKLGKLVCNY